MLDRQTDRHARQTDRHTRQKSMVGVLVQIDRQTDRHKRQKSVVGVLVQIDRQADREKGVVGLLVWRLANVTVMVVGRQ